MWKLGVLLICVITSAVSASQDPKESFAEEAVVAALPDGLVLVHVQFTQEARCSRHCTTFPKAVAQLAAAIPFTSVELSLSQGRWHQHSWGQPLFPAKPAGAELTAHFSPSLTQEALPALWGNLSHALGGLFCASLNFVARPEATAPRTLSMQPTRLQPSAQQPQQQQQDVASRTQQAAQGTPKQQQGAAVGWAPQPVREHVLYASLPQEASCTENLTPWLKLLPCRDAAGVGRLLSQRGVVFGADYHSMQVSIAVHRDAQQRPTHTTLRQSFTMVLRTPQHSSSSRQPPKPGTLSDITLSTLLGAEAPTGCPVASTSRLLLQLPPQLLQQQEGSWMTVDQLPAQIAVQEGGPTQAAAATAGTEAGAVAGTQAAAAADVISSQSMRAPHWATSLFTLSPAPDAVAVLLPPACPTRGIIAGHEPSSPAAAAAVDSGSGACKPHHVFFVYDLQHNSIARQTSVQPAPDADNAAEASAEPAHAAAAVPFSVTWQQQAATDAATAAAVESPSAAASSSLPHFAASRYITGTGQLHGGMTLQLTAVSPTVQEPTPAEGGDANSSASSSGSSSGTSSGASGSGTSSSGGGGSRMSVCVLQVVPWYIRLWLHTLQLHLDGQAVALEDLLLPSFISPAQDRKRPLVLDLCLSVPRAVHSITLTAQFTKAFLRMSEHPPDAHRGFDVPAAIVTVGDLPPVGSSGDGSVDGSRSDGSNDGSSAGGGSSSSRWRVTVVAGAVAPEVPQAASPLMLQLLQQRPQEVYSPGLVVPLAVPDFSMPYNVICLTSTVLAIFMGGTLNALVWRPGKSERDAADPKVAAAKRRRKIARVVVLGIAFVVVAVSYEADLQAEVFKQLRGLGLYHPAIVEL